MGAVSPSGRGARAQAVEGRAERSGQKPLGSHSGRLLLRMPRSLHAELAALAERDGVSLNTLITSTLATLVKRRGRRGADETPTSGRPKLVPRAQSSFLTVALVVNFLVVALAAAIAIGLLVTAWQHGW